MQAKKRKLILLKMCIDKEKMEIPPMKRHIRQSMERVGSARKKAPRARATRLKNYHTLHGKRVDVWQVYMGGIR